MNHWAVLQIAPVHDVKAIKKAYAVLLKQHKPEQDPVGYQRLREAFDSALAEAKSCSQQQAIVIDGQMTEPVIASEDDPPPVRIDPDEIQNTTSGDRESNARPLVDVSRNARHRFRHVHECVADINAAPPLNGDNVTTVQPVDDEHAIEKQVALIVTEMDAILHRAGDQAACLYLKEVLASDRFERLDRRAQLDSALFEWASHWRQRYAPLFLFEFLFNEFVWNEERNSEKDVEALRYLRDRMESARAFVKLRDLSVRSALRGDSDTRRDVRVAKILLGECNEKAFRRLSFANTDLRAVRKTLHALQRSTPIVFQYELATPTVQWFLQRLGTIYFTSTHLKLAAIAVLGLAIAWFSYWQPYTITWSWSALGAASVVAWLFVAVLLWGLQHLAMAAARLGYRQVKNALPVLHRHYVQISEQVNEHDWAYNGMFALAWGMVAVSTTRTGWESALLLMFALPISIVLWNELFVAVAFNSLLVAITMHLCDEGGTVVVPGNRLEHVMLLTFLSSYLLYWMLDLLPEKITELIADKLLRMLLIFVAFDVMVVTLFHQLNDWLAS